MRTNEIKNEIDEIKTSEDKIKEKDFKYERKKCIYDSFGDNVYTGKISIDKADMDQSNLPENMLEFNNKTRPGKYDKDKKKYF